MMRVVLVAVAAALLSGCGVVAGPEEVLGRVEAVEVPDTVRAGQAFTITVRTVGPDGCWRKARTDATVHGLTATVTPYDLDSGGTCTMSPVPMTHTAEVVLGPAGSGLVKVRGRDGTGVEVGVVVE